MTRSGERLTGGADDRLLREGQVLLGRMRREGGVGLVAVRLAGGQLDQRAVVLYLRCLIAHVSLHCLPRLQNGRAERYAGSVPRSSGNRTTWAIGGSRLARFRSYYGEIACKWGFER